MALTTESVGRPELFLKYLAYMAEHLANFGMHLHTLPLYTLAAVVAEHLIVSNDLKGVVSAQPAALHTPTEHQNVVCATCVLV
eukprot:4244939-Pyramimonas_sp.AAC.1